MSAWLPHQRHLNRPAPALPRAGSLTQRPAATEPRLSAPAPVAFLVFGFFFTFSGKLVAGVGGASSAVLQAVSGLEQGPWMCEVFVCAFTDECALAHAAAYVCMWGGVTEPSAGVVFLLAPCVSRGSNSGFSVTLHSTSCLACGLCVCVCLFVLSYFL